MSVSLSASIYSFADPPQRVRLWLFLRSGGTQQEDAKYSESHVILDSIITLFQPYDFSKGLTSSNHESL